jgi:signal transduction histidine kinase
VRELHRRKRYFYAFAFLFGLLAVLRIAMVRFSFPSRWIYSKYFDPKFFASSSFNSSVGDFVLNTLIVTIACAYFFTIYSRTEFVKASLRMSGLYRWLLSIGVLTVTFFSFLFPHLFIEAIFHDSAIPVDIASSSNFDGIRISSIFAFALGSLSSFFFVHSFIRIIKSLLSNKEFVFCLFLSSAVFLTYFLVSELNYWPTLAIGICYFIVLFFSNHYKSLLVIGYRTFPYLLIAIIAYGIQGAWGIKEFSEERKIRTMFRSASNMISNDVLGEYLLSQASQKISNDLFLASSIESPLLSKNFMRQKIRQIYLGDYLNRYEVTINLYHADGSPADAVSDIDFATSIESYQAEANRTNYEWIYLLRNTNAESLKRYLAIVPLRKNNSVRGYVALDLSLKRIVPQQVYPELLTDNRFAQTIRNKDFSYALFNGKKITDRNGNFNFDRDLNVEVLNDTQLYTTGLKQNKHWFVCAEDESGKRIVLVADAYTWLDALANFSFLFTIGVMLVFLFLIFYFIRHRFSKHQFNYSDRIQLFVYLSFILPLLAVSFIALRMITQSNEIQSQKEIESKGTSISESLSRFLDREKSDSTFLFQETKSRIAEIALTTDVDANLYSKNGELISSTQTGIFNNQLLMPLTDRNAWEKIADEHYSTLKLQERIGLLEYNSSYFAIRSATSGDLIGILELPFFNSAVGNLRSAVLSNILITFTIVFILFSFFASNAIGKLTSPLRFIAKKLNATSLANNQPIEWRSNDEIGNMVKEYNRMLGNLEQSKIELARNEKEMAWREIAKQVAHEIKNPLTPMKLTLQQMERLLLQGEISKERTESSVQTLLAQVETLNGIAGSFSAFATMPSPVMASVDLTSVLQKTVSLFEDHLLGSVKFLKPNTSVYVQSDEQLIGRIFSNIILNGLQSNKDKPVSVEVTIQHEKEWVTVCITDNGSGVSLDLRDKIFLPHFSTKETGSGLGLAIAKQGIEQMGGSIWFEATVGIGSSFYVKLKQLNPPLAN